MGKIKIDALIDNTYKTIEDKAVIYLYLINSILKDRDFKPYFYVELHKEKVENEDIEKIKEFLLKNDLLKFVENIEVVKKIILRKEKEVIKIIATHPQKVPKLRKIKECEIVKEIYEHDIPFAKRYLIDNEIIPMTYWDFENKKPVSIEIPKLKSVAFDMEVYNRDTEPNPERDPILMASFWDENGGKVITYKEFNHPNIEVVKNEKELIKKIIETLKEYDVIYTYNGDNFDFPYLKARAKIYGIDINLGKDGEELKIKRGGMEYRSYIPGRVHIDLYPISRRLLKLTKYTLEDVVYNLFGIEKLKIPHTKIVDYWANNDKTLIEYSLQDAKYTYKIGKYFFPLEVMFSRIVNQTPFEITRMSSGQMVEYLLMKRAFKENMIVPNKPDEEEYRRRVLTTYEGGYVKEPEKGMFEDIISMDFRCHPKGTKVVVKGKGIVNIEDVKEGNYVLGIDGWQKVKKVWKYEYEGELINVNGLKCTPNHKIPLRYKIKHKKINKNDYLVRDIYAKSLLTKFKGEGKLILCKDFETIGNYEKYINDMDEDFILKSELIGILLAEGHLLRRDIEYFDSSRGKKRISHQYRVEITVNEDEKDFIEKIKYIFKKLFNYELYVRRKKGTKAITLGCAKKDIYLKIEEILKNKEKYLPNAILRGFFEGDGYVNTVRRAVVVNQGTNNYDKIKFIASLLDRLGIKYSFYTYSYEERGKKLKRYVIEIFSKGDLIKFSILISFISRRKNNLLNEIIRQKTLYKIGDYGFYDLDDVCVSLESYKGEVYDLTLEGRPYYFANGILTHNSLYPSIIISYNISPDTLDCECCKDVSEKILGHWFCKKKEGLIPKTLRNLIERRINIKRRMKKMAEIGEINEEYNLLDYEQKSLKILANSILPDEYLTIIEEDGIKVVKIGEYIDDLMRKHKDKIKFSGISEILETKNLKTFSFDKITKKCEIKKVKALIRHPYFGKAYKIKLRSGRTIKVTRGHSLFKYENGKIVEVKGDDVRFGDLIVVPKKLTCVDKEVVINIPKRLINADEEEIKDLVITKHKDKAFFVKLKKTLEDIENNKLKVIFDDCILYLKELGLIDYNIIKKINKVDIKILDEEKFKAYKKYFDTVIEHGNFKKGRCNIQYIKIKDYIANIPDKEFEDCEIGAYSGKINALLKLDEKLAKFLGFFVTRGRLKKQKLKGETVYEISVYKSLPEYQKEIAETFKEVFGAGSMVKDKVTMDNKIVYLVLKYIFKCGDKDKKHIPEELFLASESVIKSFLDGFLKAKKNSHKGTSTFMAKDEKYLNQLMILFNLVGIPTRFTPVKNKGYKLTLNPKYGTVKDLMLDEVKEIEAFEYSGYVYDLSVEDNENFLVNNIYAHNSVYGYLAFPRARFYSRECAEIVTYLGRKYILETVKEAEKFGFKVLYIDTDGFYAIWKEKISKEELIKKAMEFVEYINSKLPGTMELEFEGYFKRGIFVTKKRYALIDENGRVTVKGLEFVRRDWSNIAKITQRRVLEALLVEGSIEKAKKIIQDVIKDLREKKIKKEDLIIYTQLTKDPKEYKTTAPHVEIAKKLMREGKRIKVGDIIGYIIVKGTKSISERAKLPEEVDIDDIDVNYYIDNQILPPVLRIMEAVGVSKNELKKEGAQLTLDKFFK
ncbi:DNA polymerase domain-containing protein [Methanocaldococcus jannaschii]|nr:DNA polymerase domain-containing protein [Methanocaldococcus jannaschii]